MPHIAFFLMRDRRYASLKAQRAGATPHGGSGSRDPDSKIRIVVIFCLFGSPEMHSCILRAQKGLFFTGMGIIEKLRNPGN